MELTPDDIPRDRVREIMNRSRETGNEVAISFCPPSDVEEGTPMNVNVPEPSCDVVGIVHTHPNSVPDLSEQDREVLSDDQVGMVCAVTPEDGKMKCVTSEAEGEDTEGHTLDVELNNITEQEVIEAFDDGTIRFLPNFSKSDAGYLTPGEREEEGMPAETKCAECPHWIEGGGCHVVQGEIDPEAVCRRFYADVGLFGVDERLDSGEQMINMVLSQCLLSDWDGEDQEQFVEEVRTLVENMSPKTRSMSLGNTDRCGGGMTLSKLPKGSRCEEFRSVPSRSSYHNSDEVDRCSRFRTPDDGEVLPPEEGEGEQEESGPEEVTVDVPESIGEWDRISPDRVREIEDDLVAFSITDSFNQPTHAWSYNGRFYVIVNRSESESRGVTFDADLRHVDGENVENISIRSGRQDIDDAIEGAVDWMESHDPTTPMPSFETRISGGVLSPAIEAAHRLGGTGLIEARGDALIITSQGFASEVSVALPADSFEEFDVEEPGEARFSVSELWDAVRDFNFSDTILLQTGESSAGTPRLQTQRKSAKMTHSVGFPRREVPLPRPADAQFTVTGREFKDVVDAAEPINSDMEGPVAFGVRNGEAIMVVENDAGERFKGTFDTSMVDGGQINAYDLDWFDSITTGNAIPRPASTNVRLVLQAGMPLLMEYDIDGVEVDVVVAPMDSEEIEGFDLSQPFDELPPLRQSVAAEDGRVLGEEDIPGEAWSALRDSWRGYKAALAEEETARAKQFAAVINGIRASIGQPPLEFEELDGFRGVDLSAPQLEKNYLSQPIQEGDTLVTPSGDLEIEEMDGRTVYLDDGSAMDIDSITKSIKMNLIDHIPSEETGRNLYIRFGDIPENETSTDDSSGKKLNGVSVYATEKENGIFYLKGTQLQTVFFLLNRPIYLVSGQRVGTGPDGEPLIRNVEIEKTMKTPKGVGGFIPEEDLERTKSDKKDEDEEDGSLYAPQDWDGVEPRWGSRPVLGKPTHPLDVIPKNSITIVTGRRGSGKSAAVYDLAEQAHERRGKEVYVVGFPDEHRDLLPEYVKSTEITDMQQVFNHIPEDCFVIMDEAFRIFHSRESQSEESVTMSKVIPLARHRGWDMAFVSQDSSYLDVNLVREADALLLKEPSELHMRFERSQIADILENAKDAFGELGEAEDAKEHVYVMADDYEGMLTNGLPSFWSDDLSTAFSGALELSRPGVDHISPMDPGDISPLG